MAKQEIVTFIDDLDGTAAQGTVTFALENRAYEIDLSDENTDKLHDALAPFIEHARKASRSAGAAQAAPTRKGGRTVADREQTQAIRTWARENGRQVSDRGRIPKPVVEAYNAVH
jgi:hypothetical protein